MTAPVRIEFKVPASLRDELDRQEAVWRKKHGRLFDKPDRAKYLRWLIVEAGEGKGQVRVVLTQKEASALLYAAQYKLELQADGDGIAGARRATTSRAYDKLMRALLEAGKEER